jgi:hypothetical protein
MHDVPSPVRHRRLIVEAKLRPRVQHVPPHVLVHRLAGDLLRQQRPGNHMPERRLHDQQTVGVHKRSAINIRAFAQHRAIQPVQHPRRGHRVQSVFFHEPQQPFEVVRIVPVVGVEERDRVSLQRHRLVAADQPRRVAIVPIVPFQQNMSTLEIRQLCRCGPIAHHDVLGRDRLHAHAGVCLREPFRFCFEIGRDDANLHGGILS